MFAEGTSSHLHLWLHLHPMFPRAGLATRDFSLDLLTLPWGIFSEAAKYCTCCGRQTCWFWQQVSQEIYMIYAYHVFKSLMLWDLFDLGSVDFQRCFGDKSLFTRTNVRNQHNSSNHGNLTFDLLCILILVLYQISFLIAFSLWSGSPVDEALLQPPPSFLSQITSRTSWPFFLQCEILLPE